jgi:hypothetical protein
MSQFQLADIMANVICRWDDKAHKYKIAESTEDPAVTELDEYVFVVRVRVGEYIGVISILQPLILRADRSTKVSSAYIDIKSEGLRDILRTVLRDVKAVSLDADKPTVLFT